MEEERMLLPKYARHFRLDEYPEVMRMLADHAAIRAQMEDVKECLGGSFAPEPVIELCRMLHDHVRLEEDRIFPRIEKALSEIELSVVGSGSLTSMDTSDIWVRTNCPLGAEIVNGD